MTRLLITIPTWNEAVVIGKNLRVLQDAVSRYLPEHDVTIEVADNGSTDGTREIVRRIGARLMEIPDRGKGLAIRRSWERHLDDADVLLFMDADLAAGLEALPRLIRPILVGAADLVCGSRFVPGADVKRAPHRTAASYLYRLLQRLILRLPVTDAQCGFKAISSHAARAVLPRCREPGWMFDSELLGLAARDNFRIREIPVSWIEHREPNRRSALRLFHHGWGFLTGLFRVRKALR
ncbi:glycosyltransferase [Candidatus Uhrbacteria bacterium]|nr:glycosyltransferase [Candidatus Uhrbacteria bacterium]